MQHDFVRKGFIARHSFKGLEADHKALIGIFDLDFDVDVIIIFDEFIDLVELMIYSIEEGLEQKAGMFIEMYQKFRIVEESEGKDFFCYFLKNEFDGYLSIC